METRDDRFAPGERAGGPAGRREPAPDARRGRLRLASSRPARESAGSPAMRPAPPRRAQRAANGDAATGQPPRPRRRPADSPHPDHGGRRGRIEGAQPRLNNTFRSGSAAAGGNTLRSVHSADGLRRPDAQRRRPDSVVGRPLHRTRGGRGHGAARRRCAGYARYAARPAHPSLPLALRILLSVLLIGVASSFLVRTTAGVDPATEAAYLEVAPLNQAELTLSTPIGAWKQGEFPHLYQTDPAWASKPYGGGTVALNACGPTVMSMLYVYHTGHTDMDPGTMAAWADERTFAPTGATEWAFFTDGAERLGLTSKMVNPDRSAIASALGAGHPVVCVVGPGDFTNLGHYILLTGIDEAGTVSICDPNSPRTSARRWDLTRVLHQTEVAWVFGA